MEVVEVAMADTGVRQVERDLGIARPVEDQIVGCYVDFLGVADENGHAVVLEGVDVVRCYGGRCLPRDYEFVEVTGIPGADDLADLLVGVVGHDVMADPVGVDDGALEPRQRRLAVVGLDAKVERDLVPARVAA